MNTEEFASLIPFSYGTSLTFLWRCEVTLSGPITALDLTNLIVCFILSIIPFILCHFTVYHCKVPFKSMHIPLCLHWKFGFPSPSSSKSLPIQNHIQRMQLNSSPKSQTQLLDAQQLIRINKIKRQSHSEDSRTSYMEKYCAVEQS